MTLAIAEYESSATIGTTERSLPADTTTGVPTSQTADGIWMVMLDLNALAAGDEFKLQIYEKVQSAGTQRLVAAYAFANVQSEPHFVTIGYPLGHGWDITLKKIAGTDRAIAWRITRVS